MKSPELPFGQPDPCRRHARNRERRIALSGIVPERSGFSDPSQGTETKPSFPPHPAIPDRQAPRKTSIFLRFLCDRRDRTCLALRRIPYSRDSDTGANDRAFGFEGLCVVPSKVTRMRRDDRGKVDTRTLSDVRPHARVGGENNADEFWRKSQSPVSGSCPCYRQHKSFATRLLRCSQSAQRGKDQSDEVHGTGCSG